MRQLFVCLFFRIQLRSRLVMARFFIAIQLIVSSKHVQIVI